MSWSIRSVAVPASAICRSCRPSSPLSWVSRPAAGSSRHRRRGCIAIARATPTSFRCPCVSSLGIASASEPISSNAERLVGRRVVAGGPADELRCECQPRGALGRDHEVLAHREIVEQLGALPRAGEAAAGACVRRHPREIAPVELGAARVAHEARDRVDERRLARAVRSDQPDQLALLDDDVHLVDGAHAAEMHREAGRGEDGRHAVSAGADAASSAFRFARACADR